jgi:hypothetical protein
LIQLNQQNGSVDRRRRRRRRRWCIGFWEHCNKKTANRSLKLKTNSILFFALFIVESFLKFDLIIFNILNVCVGSFSSVVGIGHNKSCV